MFVADEETAEQALLRVTRDVIERFANVFAEPADDAIALSSGECLISQACFHCRVVGVVSLAAPTGLCTAIASESAATAFTDVDLRADAALALGELARVVAGDIAGELDAGNSIRLSPSAVETLSFDDWMVLGNAQGTLRFNVEGWPLLASLAITGA